MGRRRPGVRRGSKEAVDLEEAVERFDQQPRRVVLISSGRRSWCRPAASLLKRDVYSGTLKLLGNQHLHTLSAANTTASSLNRLQRFKEAKALMRKLIRGPTRYWRG